MAVFLAISFGLASCSDRGSSGPSGPTCSLEYDLPADLPQPLAEATQADFEQNSWQTFLALNAPEVGGRIAREGDNPTQWSRWSSSVDLIQCNLDSTGCVCPGGDCSRSGARYFPPECRSVAGHESLRVLDNIDKADDAFLEAKTGGLSNSPVLDSQGRFLRYEILVSPATYDFIARNQYYDWETLQALDTGVSFPCGEASYTGGNPADPQMGGLVLKLAWMDGGLPDERYHTEDILVYTPAYRSSDGVASCERRTLSLVGMHVVHKTVKQPNWTWATFEHARNAPDCSGLPPSGQQQPRVNQGCPASLAVDYNLVSANCSDGRCAACNIPPNSNAPSGQCVDPDSDSDPGWCLDLPPAAAGGLSRICRQVSVADYYPDAAAANQECAQAIGERSVWSRYELISTQWFAFSSQPSQCENVQERFGSPQSREKILPQVPIMADPGGVGPEVPSRPWLGNSSMESYERSNCTGCHAQGGIKNAAGTTISNDFIYFLGVETCSAWCDQNDMTPCPCL